jgi:hypothetical protein
MEPRARRSRREGITRGRTPEKEKSPLRKWGEGLTNLANELGEKIRDNAKRVMIVSGLVVVVLIGGLYINTQLASPEASFAAPVQQVQEIQDTAEMTCVYPMFVDGEHGVLSYGRAIKSDYPIEDFPISEQGNINGKPPGLDKPPVNEEGVQATSCKVTYLPGGDMDNATTYVIDYGLLIK